MNREPLLAVGGVTGIAAAIFQWLAVFNVHPSQGAQTIITMIVTAVASVVVALVGRRMVTPLSDPRAADGTPLVPPPK